jgi:hypothetical protein
MRLRTRHGGDEILEREPKRRPRQNSRARGRSGTRLKVRTHTLHRRPCTCRKVASQRAVSPRTCKSTPTKEQVAHCQSSTNTSGSGGGGVGGGGGESESERRERGSQRQHDVKGSHMSARVGVSGPPVFRRSKSLPSADAAVLIRRAPSIGRVDDESNAR